MKRKVAASGNGDSLVSSGIAQAKIEMNQKTYYTFTVAKHLADVILGLDVLRQHHSVILELGGDQPEAVISARLNQLVFSEMKITLDLTLQFSL